MQAGGAGRKSERGKKRREGRAKMTVLRGRHGAAARSTPARSALVLCEQQVGDAAADGELAACRWVGGKGRGGEGRARGNGLRVAKRRVRKLAVKLLHKRAFLNSTAGGVAARPSSRRGQVCGSVDCMHCAFPALQPPAPPPKHPASQQSAPFDVPFLTGLWADQGPLLQVHLQQGVVEGFKKVFVLQHLFIGRLRQPLDAC